MTTRSKDRSCSRTASASSNDTGLVAVIEPHTQAIPRFEAGKPVEFGRKVRLDEVEGGNITGYAIPEQGGSRT